MSRGAVAVAMVLVITSCGPSENNARIQVSAASSLSDAFWDLELAYEDAHPEIDVVLNLAGSSLLREQILAGAPIDVFASASVEIMNQVDEAGLVTGEIDLFATNDIQIAVPTGNPANVFGLENFERDDLYLGLCAVEVPCGYLASKTFELADVNPRPDTNEPNVRALLTKIEAGELDAGIVYATDVMAANVDGIAIPDEFVSSASYPVARIVDSPNPAGGAEFLSFLFTDEAQRILSSHGFQRP